MVENVSFFVSGAFIMSILGEKWMGCAKWDKASQSTDTKIDVETRKLIYNDE